MSYGIHLSSTRHDAQAGSQCLTLRNNTVLHLAEGKSAVFTTAIGRMKTWLSSRSLLLWCWKGRSGVNSLISTLHTLEWQLGPERRHLLEREALLWAGSVGRQRNWHATATAVCCAVCWTTGGCAAQDSSVNMLNQSLGGLI